VEETVQNPAAEVQQAQTADVPENGGEAETRAAPERDFDGEINELLEEFPEAARQGRLPDEVIEAAGEGRTLADAYRDYALARQGQAHPAWSAPVRGVSEGYAVESQGKDAFMTGFDDL